jgi:predicted nucleotidyltransferase
MNRELILPKEQLAAYCRAHGIRRLAVFGSALRDDFGPDSDIDLLVEFAPDSVPGLLGIARMERELSALLGRKVDLRTPQDLSPYFREGVMEEAEVQYARG